MAKFLCLRRCYVDRLYEAGKTYEFDKKPNHHFAELDRDRRMIEDAEHEFDPSTAANFDADSFEALMAKSFRKKEIVDHVKENYNKDISKADQGVEKDDKKEALVKAAIEARENFVPEPR